jgi:hypothetical protein
MFNLEEAISEWKRQIRAAGVKNPNVVEELESHLLEDVARQTQSGVSAEQAFKAAVERVGHPSLLKREFAKLGGKKWELLKKLKGILVGFCVPFPSLSTFTPSARRTLELARMEAPRLHHDFIGTEHVLLGLLALENGVVPNVLKRMGVDREDLRRHVENWVGISQLQTMPAELPYTPRAKKSLQLAAGEAKASHQACVGAEHIFLGLLLEGDGVAGRVLTSFGISSESTRSEILKEQNENQCGS